MSRPTKRKIFFVVFSFVTLVVVGLLAYRGVNAILPQTSHKLMKNNEEPSCLYVQSTAENREQGEYIIDSGLQIGGSKCIKASLVRGESLRVSFDQIAQDQWWLDIDINSTEQNVEFFLCDKGQDSASASTFTSGRVGIKNGQQLCIGMTRGNGSFTVSLKAEK